MQELPYKAAVLLKWDVLESAEASPWLRCVTLSTQTGGSEEVARALDPVAGLKFHSIA